MTLPRERKVSTRSCFVHVLVLLRECRFSSSLVTANSLFTILGFPGSILAGKTLVRSSLTQAQRRFICLSHPLVHLLHSSTRILLNPYITICLRSCSKLTVLCMIAAWGHALLLIVIWSARWKGAISLRTAHGSCAIEKSLLISPARVLFIFTQSR